MTSHLHLLQRSRLVERYLHSPIHLHDHMCTTSNSMDIISVPALFWEQKYNWAYEITKLSVCLWISPIVARQRLGKHFTTATNIHARIEELFEAYPWARNQERLCCRDQQQFTPAFTLLMFPTLNIFMNTYTSNKSHACVERCGMLKPWDIDMPLCYISGSLLWGEINARKAL
jgi:hypothetical protein